MTEMTLAEARRVLTKLAKEFADARNHRKRLGYGINEPYHGDVSAEAVDALAFALSQAWVEREIAQAVLPLVEDEVAGAKWCDENNPHFSESNTAKWQALVDALAEE
jgi:hypothetical protein